MATKIYGTIGPACCEVETLVALFEKGMTGVRINLSHVDLSDVKDWIEHIKQAYASVTKTEKEKQGLEILIDLVGPEVRLGHLSMDWKLKDGDRITVMEQGNTNLFEPTELPLPKMVFDALKIGTEVLIDDGKILLRVEEKRAKAAECEVLRGGTLRSGKSVAIPGVTFEMPTLTERDLLNLKEAKTYGVTSVMLPFVRGKEDLINLRKALDEVGAKELRILAKIENLDGVQKLDEFFPYCDEVVIARGDLGNSVPLWELPVYQAKIAKRCNRAEKPFMVVTQMLASMEQSAVPTRAEVSDIYRAIDEGAASVMLTGETAAGKYPVEAMEYMVKTVYAAEEYKKGV